MEQILVIGIGEIGLAEAQIQDQKTGVKHDCILLTAEDNDQGRTYQIGIPENEFDRMVSMYLKRKASKAREESGLVIPGRMPSSDELETMSQPERVAAQEAGAGLSAEDQRKIAAAKMPPRPREET